MYAEQSAGPSQQPSMTVEEKLQSSRNYKEDGNNFYKAKNYKVAIGKYHRALLFVKGIEKHNDMCKLPRMFGANTTTNINLLSKEMENEVGIMKADCYNNLAACLLQQENPSYEKVIKYCGEVLRIDPKNVKALYRKGVAYYNLKDYDQCLKTLQEAETYAITRDSSIQRYIGLSEKHIQQYKERERERYKGMFEKLANIDLQTSA